MYKLVVLSCVLSVAFAGLIPTVEYQAQIKSYVEPHHTIVETPTVQHVGSVVKSIPTGVSHHSSSVVHSDAKIGKYSIIFCKIQILIIIYYHS